MATLYITEYKRLGEDQRGHTVLVGQEPSVARQTVTYTTSAQSNTLNKGTKFVRVIADADAHLRFDPDPTATAGDTKIEANQAEYFGVDGVKQMKIAAYDGSS